MCTDRQTGRYLDASLHYQTRGSSQWERARERDDEDRKPFPVHRHHRPFGEESMWPPLAVYQSFSFPSWSLIFLEDTPAQTSSTLSYTCDVKKKLEKPCDLPYVPANFHSNSANPIYIADHPSENNRRDNRVSNRYWSDRSQSAIISRIKRRTTASYLL